MATGGGTIAAMHILARGATLSIAPAKMGVTGAMHRSGLEAFSSRNPKPGRPLDCPSVPVLLFPSASEVGSAPLSTQLPADRAGGI
jgi:hypothetical protein